MNEVFTIMIYDYFSNLKNYYIGAINDKIPKTAFNARDNQCLFRERPFDHLISIGGLELIYRSCVFISRKIRSKTLFRPFFCSKLTINFRAQICILYVFRACTLLIIFHWIGASCFLSNLILAPPK